MSRKIVPATVAFLFSAVAFVSEAGAQGQEPELLWSQRVGFQPVDIKVGDLNGDSRPDVVVGYSEPAVVAIDSGGDVLWRFATRQWIWNLAIGDLDGDGHDDVIAVDYQQPSYMYALSGSGALLWSYRLPSPAGGVGPADQVKVGDVVGNGRNQVIVAVGDTLFVFDNQGALLFRHVAPSTINSIELAQVVLDSGVEVVIAYGYRCPPCGVQVFNYSDNVLWDFSTPVRLGQAVGGDVNADVAADVVVAESDIGARNVYAIDSSGSLLWTFQQGEPVFGYGSAALASADIDGDGSLETVVGSADHHIYLLDPDGLVKWAFEIGSNVSQVAVGDLDGNGRKEIAASTIGPPAVWPHTGVYAIDSDGTGRWFFPKSPVSSVQGFRDLAIADLDNDGRAEVVAIQDDQSESGDHGRAFALSTPTVEHIIVDIDIKPGDGTNSINPRSRGKIPVAIVSSPTFGVLSEVHTSSLSFGRTGEETSLAFCNPEDVNKDGLQDLVCHFDTGTTGFLAGDTQGVLKGETRSGVPLQGMDSVRIVP